MKRKTIIVDLDNVVYDWVNAISVWLLSNNAVNYTTAEEMNNDYRNWNVWEDWGMAKGDFMRWWRMGVEAEVIYARGLVMPGAREALWTLSDAEWNIHIATNRLTKFGLHRTIAHNTTTWLYHANIPYRELSLVTNKHKIMAEAIVDDRKDNMKPSSHGKVFLFPANHNKDRIVTDEEQYETWQEIVRDLV